MALIVSTTVSAKTTTLLCETLPLVQPGLKGSAANQSRAKNTDYSTWNVVVQSDAGGKVTSVKLNDAEKEFALKGDTLQFRNNFLSLMEINLQTKLVRTTLTGYDTEDQGTCKEVSVVDSAPPKDAAAAKAVPVVQEAAVAKLAVAEPKALVINEIQVTDAEKYKEYASQVPATLLPFGGVMVVRGGNVEVLSGAEFGGRVVILEFPSRAKAMAWHESADYQKILKVRNASSNSRVFIVDEVAP